MSISSVVTRGFNAGVKFIPTRGYLPATTPTPIVTLDKGAGGGKKRNNRLFSRYDFIEPHKEEKKTSLSERTPNKAKAYSHAELDFSSQTIKPFTLGDNEEVRAKLEALKSVLSETRQQQASKNKLALILLLTS